VTHGEEEKDTRKVPALDRGTETFPLSDAHSQMARELGLNPKKFGGLANTKQEPWKAPLPEFIEALYFKHFKKRRPDKTAPQSQLSDEEESPPQ